MCKVFQDGEHANRNTHYILILGRKYEEFFVVLLSFLHNAIYSINYIHSVVTLFKEIHVRLTINRLLTFKTFLQQNYCENINQNNDQYSRSPIKRPLSCTIIAAERQRGSTLFLTTSVVFPEPTRPSLSPRSIYSRDLDLCPSVCLSVNGGGTNLATFVETRGWWLGVAQNSFVMRTHFIPCGLLMGLLFCLCVVKPASGQYLETFLEDIFR